MTTRASPGWHGSSTAHTSDNKQLRSPGSPPSTLTLPARILLRARTEPMGTIVVTAQDTMLATQVLVAETTVTCGISSPWRARSCRRSSPSRVSLYSWWWRGRVILPTPWRAS
jgi:hypothetical protein